MRSINDERELKAAIDGGRAAVLFRATWRPYCRAFKPIFEDSCEPLEAVLDDEDNSLWDAFSIETIPTVIFFENGRVISRQDARGGVGLEESDSKRALQQLHRPRKRGQVT